MQWGNEADLQLFKILLKTHEVKIDYKVLAEGMGNGITPKAITHRIGKIRSLPTMSGEGNPLPSISPPKPKMSPKKAPGPRAKAGATGSPKGKGRAKGNKRSAAMIEDSDVEAGIEFRAVQDDEGGEKSPAKRAKKVKLGEKFYSSQETDEANDAAAACDVNDDSYEPVNDHSYEPVNDHSYEPNDASYEAQV